MKKIFALLLAAVMCLSLAACGAQQELNGNETENEGTVVTVENWENYLELVIETNEDNGFLDYRVYLKAKEGIIISAETNTEVHFSHNMNKQHYTKENDKIILGECEAIEDTYTTTLVLYGYQNKEEYCEQIDTISGSSWSFTEGDRWTIIPDNFVITEIEGTIVAE